MYILRLQDAQTLDTPNGNRTTPLATPRSGSTEVTVVRQRQLPGGFNPVHTQSREEVMVLLSGEVTVRSGPESAQLSAGDTLIVPAHQPHQIANTGTTDAEWLIVSPTGMRFFREDGAEMHPAWIQ